MALKGATDEMISDYRAQEWDKAGQHVEKCRGLINDFRIAGLYDLYETRIAEYKETPPAADWDGVFIATTK